MSTAHQGPLDVVPVHELPRRRPSLLLWFVRFFVFLVLMGSLALNFLLFVLWLPFVADSSTAVQERIRSGSKLAADAIAIVHVDGVLMEGRTSFAEKEMDRAASNSSVKAVVM